MSKEFRNLSMNYNQSYNFNKFSKILKYGSFYNPAWKHYGIRGSNVVCDRCKKSYLSACIGFEDVDLCLTCSDELVRNSSYYGTDEIEEIDFKPIFPKHPIFSYQSQILSKPSIQQELMPTSLSLARIVPFSNTFQTPPI
jgi:hypothetical protein